MHHFVSTDLCIVAVFCTAPDFFFGFIKTFLTLTVNTASALGLADYDSPVFFTHTYLRVVALVTDKLNKQWLMYILLIV